MARERQPSREIKAGCRFSLSSLTWQPTACRLVAEAKRSARQMSRCCGVLHTKVNLGLLDRLPFDHCGRSRGVPRFALRRLDVLAFLAALASIGAPKACEACGNALSVEYLASPAPPLPFVAQPSGHQPEWFPSRASSSFGQHRSRSRRPSTPVPARPRTAAPRTKSVLGDISAFLTQVSIRP